MEEIRIILPQPTDDDVSRLMRCLTRALYRITQKEWGGGCFGGTWGYGLDIETDVFSMFPFYWDDCTCGYEQRWSDKERLWSIDNPHAAHCYQTELKSRMAAYERQSGYATIELAAFGGGVSLFGGFNTSTQEDGICMTTVMTPRKDDAMEAWRTAHDARGKFERELYSDLCSRYGKKRQGCAIHCTCGRDEKYRAFVATDNHDSRCPTVRPNFLHKSSGATVEWYKYIGRGMDVKAPKGFDWRECVRECIASARKASIAVT